MKKTLGNGWVWLLACALALASGACGPKGPYVWASQLPPAASDANLLRAGDRVQVVVHGQDTMSGEFDVRPTGDLLLPVAGRVVAAGLTPEALAARLTAQLKGVLAQPVVTVVLATRKLPSVTVVGEVRTPGRLDLKDGAGVLDALAGAGGLTPFADADSVFVLRRGPSGQQRIRFKYSDLISAQPHSIGFELKDGDVVVAE